MKAHESLILCIVVSLSNKHFLSACFMPGTVLNIKFTNVVKTRSLPLGNIQLSKKKRRNKNMITLLFMGFYKEGNGGEWEGVI